MEERKTASQNNWFVSVFKYFLSKILIELLRTDPQLRIAVCRVTREYHSITQYQDGTIEFHGLEKIRNWR